MAITVNIDQDNNLKLGSYKTQGMLQATKCTKLDSFCQNANKVLLTHDWNEMSIVVDGNFNLNFQDIVTTRTIKTLTYQNGKLEILKYNEGGNKECKGQQYKTVCRSMNKAINLPRYKIVQEIFESDFQNPVFLGTENDQIILIKMNSSCCDYDEVFSEFDNTMEYNKFKNQPWRLFICNDKKSKKNLTEGNPKGSLWNRGTKPSGILSVEENYGNEIEIRLRPIAGGCKDYFLFNNLLRDNASSKLKPFYSIKITMNSKNSKKQPFCSKPTINGVEVSEVVELTGDEEGEYCEVTLDLDNYFKHIINKSYAAENKKIKKQQDEFNRIKDSNVKKIDTVLTQAKIVLEKILQIQRTLTLNIQKKQNTDVKILKKASKTIEDQIDLAKNKIKYIERFKKTVSTSSVVSDIEKFRRKADADGKSVSESLDKVTSIVKKAEDKYKKMLADKINARLAKKAKDEAQQTQTRLTITELLSQAEQVEQNASDEFESARSTYEAAKDETDIELLNISIVKIENAKEQLFNAWNESTGIRDQALQAKRNDTNTDIDADIEKIKTSLNNVTKYQENGISLHSETLTLKKQLTDNVDEINPVVKIKAPDVLQTKNAQGAAKKRNIRVDIKYRGVEHPLAKYEHDSFSAENIMDFVQTLDKNITENIFPIIFRKYNEKSQDPFFTLTINAFKAKEEELCSEIKIQRENGNYICGYQEPVEEEIVLLILSSIIIIIFGIVAFIILSNKIKQKADKTKVATLGRLIQQTESASARKTEPNHRQPNMENSLHNQINKAIDTAHENTESIKVLKDRLEVLSNNQTSSTLISGISSLEQTISVVKKDLAENEQKLIIIANKVRALDDKFVSHEKFNNELRDDIKHFEAGTNVSIKKVTDDLAMVVDATVKVKIEELEIENKVIDREIRVLTFTTNEAQRAENWTSWNNYLGKLVSYHSSLKELQSKIAPSLLQVDMSPGKSLQALFDSGMSDASNLIDLLRLICGKWENELSFKQVLASQKVAYDTLDIAIKDDGKIWQAELNGFFFFNFIRPISQLLALHQLLIKGLPAEYASQLSPNYTAFTDKISVSYRHLTNAMRSANVIALDLELYTDYIALQSKYSLNISARGAQFTAAPLGVTATSVIRYENWVFKDKMTQELFSPNLNVLVKE
ncbi:MAG: hypothetical protein methR_P2767 [Methyloprofundus sp.]|nr:MAG: hypothetical protein methR_P2767 [Methyloprofundus sp.]